MSGDENEETKKQEHQRKDSKSEDTFPDKESAEALVPNAEILAQIAFFAATRWDTR